MCSNAWQRVVISVRAFINKNFFPLNFYGFFVVLLCVVCEWKDWEWFEVI